MDVKKTKHRENIDGVTDILGTEESEDGEKQVREFKISAREPGSKSKEIINDWSASIQNTYVLLHQVSTELAQISSELDELIKEIKAANKEFAGKEGMRKLSDIGDLMKTAAGSAARAEEKFAEKVAGKVNEAAKACASMTDTQLSGLTSTQRNKFLKSRENIQKLVSTLQRVKNEEKKQDKEIEDETVTLDIEETKEGKVGNKIALIENSEEFKKTIKDLIKKLEISLKKDEQKAAEYMKILSAVAEEIYNCINDEKDDNDSLEKRFDYLKEAIESSLENVSSDHDRVIVKEAQALKNSINYYDELIYDF